MQFLLLLVLFTLCQHNAAADISEYFLRDPYDQLDLFRQSNPRLKEMLESNKLGQESSGSESVSEKKDEDLYDEYYDYLSDVGAISTTESTTSTASTTTTAASQKLKPFKTRLRPRKGPLTVADDILSQVKQMKTHPRRMSSPAKRYSYQQPQIQMRDNMAAAEQNIKRVGRPQQQQQQQAHKKRPVRKQPNLSKKASVLSGLENVERLIPSSLMTVIEDSGKRIVKAVMQPINSVPRNTQIRETSFVSTMGEWMQPYRTYFNYMAPTFAPSHITTFLVTQWISTIAITIAWVSVGFVS